MINLNTEDFLKNYWQKTPLVIRSALLGFENPLSGEELAGLAMEEEIESRLVFETPNVSPYWRLQHGPFAEEVFSQLPESHWTLLVQGVDRFVPEVALLLNYFNFLPQWRVDDVMISYAVQGGGVGPHYDNYDVFLYQAKGRRKWLLTSLDCVPDNYQPDLQLRIMKTFNTEQEIILEEGDMLYLPPHIAHHGISLSEECITYSFGYRSYQVPELLNSFSDWVCEQDNIPALYKDPLWNKISGSSELPEGAWLSAKKCLQNLLNDEAMLKKWFASFVTTLDSNAESLLLQNYEEDSEEDFESFQSLLKQENLSRNPLCRFTYITQENAPTLTLFINGCEWETENVAPELIKIIANNREISQEMLAPFVKNSANQTFLYNLWKLQWLEFQES